MAQRNVIEETFRVIAPRRRGIPPTAPLGTSVDSGGGDFNTALSQAAQEISQLRAQWLQQAALIAANTSALQNNTGVQGRSTACTAAHVATSVFGGALGFLSPVAKGLLGLFGGGGSSAPAPLPLYVPPPPVSISGVVRSTGVTAESPASAQPGTAPTQTGAASQPAAGSQQITVNINAMDSQSFLDRSHDIASAVRLAMLNLHPINNVVADL